MIAQGGLFVKKQEMTKLWIEQRFVSVTLVSPVMQKVTRHKTVEKDGYSALVVEVQGNAKKPTLKEIRVADEALSVYAAGTVLNAASLGEATSVRVTGTSKGK